MEKRNEVNRKLIIHSFSVFILVLVIFCAIQFIDYSIIKPINIIQDENPEIVEWALENIIMDDHYISISGYAFMIGEASREFDLNIVLKNTETKEAFEIPTVLVIKDEINDFVQDEIDYSQSGFFSKINTDIINFDRNSFYIYIEYNNNDHQIFIDTKQLLIKGGS